MEMKYTTEEDEIRVVNIREERNEGNQCNAQSFPRDRT